MKPWSLLPAVDHVMAKCPHRLGEFHAGEAGRPVGQAVPSAEVAMVQLHPTGRRISS